MGSNIPRSLKPITIVRTATVALSLDKLLFGQLSFLNKKYTVVAISSGGKELSRVRTREGVMTLAIPITRKIAPFDDIKSIVKMVKALRVIKPLVIHSITPKAGLVSMVSAFIARVPIRIHTFTGLIFPTASGAKKRLLIFVDKIICRLATVIIPEGQGVKNLLEEYCITDKPMKVLANGNINGIDIQKFDPNQKYKVPESIRPGSAHEPEKTVFCFIGRINREKGVIELIEAFSKLVKDNLKAKLYVIGNIEDDHNLPEKVLSKLFSEQEIYYFGYQDDVRPYLALSDILVLPSYREGFPNSLIQAGAMGLACITTDIAGSNEIIKHEFNGLLIKDKDTKSLEKSMRRLIKNPELRSQLSKNSRQTIIERFEDKTVWDAVNSLYMTQIRNYYN